MSEKKFDPIAKLSGFFKSEKKPDPNWEGFLIEDVWDNSPKQPEILNRLGLSISKEDATTIAYLADNNKFDCMAVEIGWHGTARLMIASRGKYNPKFFPAGEIEENWNAYLAALRKWQSSRYPNENLRDGAVIISDAEKAHSIIQGSRVTRECGSFCFPGPIPYRVQRMIPTYDTNTLFRNPVINASLFLSIARAQVGNLLNGGNRRI
jgi:hypothetical protein